MNLGCPGLSKASNHTIKRYYPNIYLTIEQAWKCLIYILYFFLAWNRHMVLREKMFYKSPGEHG